MPYFDFLEGLPPKRALRIAVFFCVFLVCAELVARTVTLYPFIPGQRFHNLWSAAALAPNGRQIGEAIDQVARAARPGDWVLVGDSILNGTHVPRDYTPAAVIRQRLRQRGLNNQVWDLSLVGGDPAMYCAILDRLGALPGVMVVTNVSVKPLVHPNLNDLYFAELWDDMRNWKSTNENVRPILDQLEEAWFDHYSSEKHADYGENTTEQRVTVWMNTHIVLLSLDHWIRYNVTDVAWPQVFSGLLMGQTQFYGAKDFDVIWHEWPHEPAAKALEKLDQIESSFARVPAENKPLWRAYLMYLDLIRDRGKLGIVSIHTLSPYTERLLPISVRDNVDRAYDKMRDEITKRGLAFVEPRNFILEQEYTDVDHYGITGNKRWAEAILRTAGF